MKIVKCSIITMVFVSLFSFSMGFGNAEESIGAAQMVLNGGSKGDVSFPHETHQKALNDCMACHKIFPRESGIIVKMIAEGKLQKKEVMNHCKGCHRTLSDEGKKAGPTSCAKCHDKGK